MTTYRHGIIHAIAKCTGCGWSDQLDPYAKDGMGKLRHRIKKHVQANHHSVTFEVTTSTDYTP